MNDARIMRLAQVIHDSYVLIHPDAPAELRRKRGKPSSASISAAHAIYESAAIRADLAATVMPPQNGEDR